MEKITLSGLEVSQVIISDPAVHTAKVPESQVNNPDYKAREYVRARLNGKGITLDASIANALQNGSIETIYFTPTKYNVTLVDSESGEERTEEREGYEYAGHITVEAADKFAASQALRAANAKKAAIDVDMDVLDRKFALMVKHGISAAQLAELSAAI